MPSGNVNELIYSRGTPYNILTRNVRMRVCAMRLRRIKSGKSTTAYGPSQTYNNMYIHKTHRSAFMFLVGTMWRATGSLVVSVHDIVYCSYIYYISITTQRKNRIMFYAPTPPTHPHTPPACSFIFNKIISIKNIMRDTKRIHSLNSWINTRAGKIYQT